MLKIYPPSLRGETRQRTTGSRGGISLCLSCHQVTGSIVLLNTFSLNNSCQTGGGLESTSPRRMFVFHNCLCATVECHENRLHSLLPAGAERGSENCQSSWTLCVCVWCYRLVQNSSCCLIKNQKHALNMESGCKHETVLRAKRSINFIFYIYACFLPSVSAGWSTRHWLVAEEIGGMQLINLCRFRFAVETLRNVPQLWC